MPASLCPRLPAVALATVALTFGGGLAYPPGADAATGGMLVGTSNGQAVGGKRVTPRVRLVSRSAAIALHRAGGVRFVEPNRAFTVSTTKSTVPNDPLFRRQWPLARAYGLGAAGAWWTTKGRGAVIAFLDTGVDLTHPDIAPNLWINPREVPGNGIDDDGNGYVDDVHGVNVIAANGNPEDGHGHGTEMSGAAAALGGNHIGVTGVAPEARIMPVKVIADNGEGNTTGVIAGIQYAVANGADVINLSLNGPDRSQALDEALQAARAAGITVVASAGNDGADRARTPSYPASSPGVIAVGATSAHGGLAPFSAYGASVPIAAPGEDVLSTTRGGGYASSSGTSIASAQVSGAVALLSAARPAATPDQIRSALLGGAHRLRRNSGKVATGGTLDAADAVSRLIPGTGPKLRLAARRVTRSRAGAVTLRWRARGALSAVALYRVTLGRHEFAVGARLRSRLGFHRRVAGLRTGRYRWSVSAYDASGRRLARRVGRIRVAKRRSSSLRGGS